MYFAKIATYLYAANSFFNFLLLFTILSVPQQVPAAELTIMFFYHFFVDIFNDLSNSQPKGECHFTSANLIRAAICKYLCVITA